MLRAVAWRVIGCEFGSEEEGAARGEGAHVGGKVIMFGETFEHLEMWWFLLGFWARCAR